MTDPPPVQLRVASPGEIVGSRDLTYVVSSPSSPSRRSPLRLAANANFKLFDHKIR